MIEENAQEQEIKRQRKWWSLKDRCPRCENMDLIWTGRYRRKWFHKPNGKWELKEQQKRLCNSCNYEWWI